MAARYATLARGVRRRRTQRERSTLRSSPNVALASAISVSEGLSRTAPSQVSRTGSQRCTLGTSEEGTVRSTFSLRSVGLLFVLLGMALSGCGTIPDGIGDRLHAPLLELPRGGAGGESALSDASPRGTGEMAAVPAAEPTSPTGPQDQTAAEATPRAAVPAPEPPEPAFVPVALDLIPRGQSSHLIVLADRSDPQPGSASAQNPDVAEPESDLDEIEEYDPWERYNEKVFTFNYNVDKYVLKPVAKAYNFVVPDLVQQMIGRGFDNMRVVPKLVNNVLQWNWKGFGVELGRFVINTTLGIAGIFDIAGQEFGLEKTKVDFGQTLGKWGVKPGPFLIVPFLPPLTVRDGIGTGVDGAMDPLGYVLPFFPDRLAMRIGDIINDRSLNLELFQGFEETTLDLYSAVRNGYLQRRYNLIHNSP
jgi:phospholipid-binding lipoprotein MlaA